MNHWADPISRGVYTHPHAIPPPPSHPRANDLSARLARVEEHIHHSALDRVRIEQESRLRARDLGLGVSGLHHRLSLLEQERHTRREVSRLAWTFAKSAIVLAKWLGAAILALLYVKGAISAEGLKIMLGALGLPSGS